MLNEIKRLNILLDLKDGEIGRLDKLAEHLRNEFDAKYNALQVKADANTARYLQLKEDNADAEKIAAEHTEYERVIHELGGKTISEVEADALNAVRGVVREFKNRGADSWEVADYISELRYLTNLFPLVLSRHAIMKKWLDRYPDVQPSKQHAPRFRALSPTVPSRLVKDRLDMFMPAQNRRPIPNRGDGNYRAPVVPRGRSSRSVVTIRGGGSRQSGSGRSSGQSSRQKETVDIDFLLNPPTRGWASYFNCSKKPDEGGPSNA